MSIIGTAFLKSIAGNNSPLPVTGALNNEALLIGALALITGTIVVVRKRK